ncbi:MAG: fasciclin domain-containing protein [Proteobacteria bacterium]|nr:fasciclin domain-containing protein [Pseudomonadota bacterium]
MNLKSKPLLSKMLLTLGISLFLFGCDNNNNNNNNSDEPTITALAASNENFSTLVLALQTAGLDGALDDPDATYTVFAPTNAAFEKLGEDTINALLADPDALANILLYHVIDGAEVDSTAAIASAGTTVDMANGDKVALSLSGSDLLVNFSTVVDVDLMASNGIVHVIDTVLIPPADPGEPTNNIVETAILDGSFTTLVGALQATGLDALLGDENETFTVFAPTDAAFAALPPGLLAGLTQQQLTDILTLHVIPGAAVDSITALSLNGTSVATANGAEVDLLIMDGALMVNNAKVIVYDVYATNGIIHVIDAVIAE